MGIASFISSHAVSREPLQERTRLVGVNVNLLALLNRRTDYAQRGAVPGGSQCSSVAVGQHSAFVGHQRGTVSSHGLVGGDVFGVHALGFFDEILLDLRDGSNAHPLELFLHAADGPEEIHGRRTGFADDVADLVEFAFQVADGFCFGILDGRAQCPWPRPHQWQAPRAPPWSG